MALEEWFETKEQKKARRQGVALIVVLAIIAVLGISLGFI